MHKNIRVSAPGKVVLAGEYVVTLGGTALASAVSRFATVSLTTRNEGDWLVTAKPLQQSARLPLETLKKSTESHGIAGLVAHASPPLALPNHAELVVDSRDFFYNQSKLGIGSSAATLVSLVTLFDQFRTKPASFATVCDLHQKWQQSSGSGVDVATAIHGGTVIFNSNRIESTSLSSEISAKYLYAGYGTSTATMLSKFRDWERGANSDKGLLNSWIECAENVAKTTKSADSFLFSMSKLIDIMKRFDRDTGLGIFGPEHTFACKVAEAVGVLYKPCGAGGGDLGVALARDSEALSQFEKQVSEHDISFIDMRTTEHGVRVRTH